MEITHTGLRRKPTFRVETRRFTGVTLGFLAVTILSGCQPGPGLPFGFGPPFDNFIGIFLLFAVVAILYAAFARNIRARWNGIRLGTAESIARERYARGEITQEQYLQILRTLDLRP